MTSDIAGRTAEAPFPAEEFSQTNLRPSVLNGLRFIIADDYPIRGTA